MNAVKVGSLRDPGDSHRAAQIMRAGQPVGVLGRSVASIWVDAANAEAVAAVYRIKGANRAGMPMGMLLEQDQFPALVDPDLIAAELRPLFLDGAGLAARLSTLVWIRFPLRRAAAARLPPSLVSTTPDGTPWGQGWLTDQGDAHGILVARLMENGLRLLAPTSMNVSGEPEIVTVAAGVDFSARHGIALFMRDPDDRMVVRGSYPIVEISRRGVRLVREGHFPGGLLSRLLDGMPVDMDGYRPAKYPLLPAGALAAAGGLSGPALHAVLQAALNGHASSEGMAVPEGAALR